MTVSAFRLRERPVGNGASTFIVAEIGANHNGDAALAAEMIRVAAGIGVDAIKLQTYTADCLLADKERVITWSRTCVRWRKR